MSEQFRETIVRGFLRNISLSYRNEDGSYIADDIFAVITGLNKEAKIYSGIQADSFRSEAKARGPLGEYPIAETRAKSIPVDPVNYAMAKDIADEFRTQVAAPGNFPFRLDAEAVMYIMDQILMKKEIDASALIYATSWNGNSAGGLDAAGLWGAPAAIDDTMAVDLQDAATAILSKTGKKPTHLMLTWPAWAKISISPFWIEKINFTKFTGVLTTSELASVIGYQVVVGSGITNTAKEETTGTAFTSKFIMAPVTDPTKGAAFLYHRPSTPGLDVLSPGYQYRIDQGTGGVDLRKWRNPNTKSDRYGADCEYDIKEMCTDCAVQFKDTAVT